jgi:hypothetical protein
MQTNEQGRFAEVTREAKARRAELEGKAADRRAAERDKEIAAEAARTIIQTANTGLKPKPEDDAD